MLIERKHTFLKVYLCLIAMCVAVIFAGCNCEDTGQIGAPPEIQVTPSNLVFGAISVGDKINRSLIVKNIGLQELTITELLVVNEQSAKAFELLTKKDLPLKLQANEEVKLTVRYQPQRAGSARGHLRIVSDAQNVENAEGLTKVPFRSSQLNADISVTPNPVEFGTVRPKEGEVKTITITNRGQAELNITGMEFKDNAANEFAIKTEVKYPLKLAPKKTTKIDISYNPNKNVADEILYINSNTPGVNKYEVRLVGQRAAPDIEVTPTKLTFSKVLLGTKGVEKFEIKNKGTIDLVLEGIQIAAGTSPDFDLPNPPEANLKIAPGKSIEVEVSYNSRDTKDDTGTLKVLSNDPDSPEVKVLLEAKAKGCQIEATPSQLHFTRPSQLSFTVFNKGNLPCTYKGASLSPNTSSEFSFFAPPPSAKVLNPGGSITFEIDFSPKDGKDDQGEVWISTSDPDTPKTVIKLSSQLSAASACQIKVSPTTIQFGFVGTGRSRRNAVTITNSGFGDCELTNANINPNPNNAFIMITQVPATGLRIPTNSKIELNVAYTPPNAGTHAGVLTVNTNDPKAPQVQITLNGQSGKLCLEILPDPLDFGSVKTGCSSQREKMQIYNICSAAATVSAIDFGPNTNKGHVEFFKKSVPTLPKTLAFGQALEITLSYVPKDLGVDVGTLQVTNSIAGQGLISITLRGEGVDTDTQKDVFKQLNKPEIDILFDIDNSCSMGNDQTNLANNTQSFISWAAQLQVDYHIGVTTTDERTKGCLRGSTKIITPQTPNLISVFKSNAVAGTRGSATERGLSTAHMALTNPSLSGCNQGFYRPNAALSIVFVSDEPDYSQQPVTFYINFFRNLKGFRNPDKIRVSAIGSVAASTCAGGGGGSGCRYYEVSKALRGIYERISSANWGQTLSQLGAVTFGYRTQFFLSRPADPKTIKVKVNGSPIAESATSGWSYETNSNSVNFAKAVVPAAGTLIEITYRAICLAP